MHLEKGVWIWEHDSSELYCTALDSADCTDEEMDKCGQSWTRVEVKEDV